MSDKNHRDAGTGQFVTDEYAEANPGSTVSETDARWWGQEQAPSVGRIVHYVSYGTPGGEYHSKCRAAVITEVLQVASVEDLSPSIIGLAVLNPTGVFFHPAAHENGPCPQNESRHEGGTWHWPERT